MYFPFSEMKLPCKEKSTYFVLKLHKSQFNTSNIFSGSYVTHHATSKLLIPNFNQKSFIRYQNAFISTSSCLSSGRYIEWPHFQMHSLKKTAVIQFEFPRSFFEDSFYNHRQHARQYLCAGHRTLVVKTNLGLSINQYWWEKGLVPDRR